MEDYSNAPQQIQCKLKCKCKKCNKVLPKGEDIYYFPSDNSVFCLPCGVGSYNYFLETFQDEEFLQISF